MQDKASRAERVNFLMMAIASEAVLLLIAIVVGWISGRPAWARLTLSLESIGLGMIATLPLFALLTFIYQTHAKPLVQFRELVGELLGRPLAACRWPELFLVALLAGVSEEFLFRGILEPWLSGWSPLFGIVVCNLLFGLCHALTPTYFIFATLVGLYLSTTLWWTKEPNLVIPVCCHALYDLVAFAVVRNAYRKNDLQSSPEDGVNDD